MTSELPYRHLKPLSQVLSAFFYGNYFYGLCAVALTMEAAIQQRTPVTDPALYIGIFCVTVWYYTRAYLSEQNPGENHRSQWYNVHRSRMQLSQVVMAVGTFASFLIAFYPLATYLNALKWWHWGVMIVLCLLTGLYYGLHIRHTMTISLRSVGWLKPYLIGMVWAGTANFLPMLYYDLKTGVHDVYLLPRAVFFFKNLMFVSVLCIMFDIKDYAQDANNELKTYVVTHGLRDTISRLIIPLIVLGVGGLIIFSIVNHHSIPKFMVNLIPFIALFFLAISLYRRQSILYLVISE